MNTHTKFQNSICKTLDVTIKKLISIARLTKLRETLIWEKMNSPLIRLRIGIFKNIFNRWFHTLVVHSSRKNRFPIFKNKGRGREKLIFIARYKNLFYFSFLKFRLKSTAKTLRLAVLHVYYTSRLTLVKVFHYFNLISIHLNNYFLLTVTADERKKFGEGNWIDSNSLRDKNFLTKI